MNAITLLISRYLCYSLSADNCDRGSAIDGFHSQCVGSCNCSSVDVRGRGLQPEQTVNQTTEEEKVRWALPRGKAAPTYAQGLHTCSPCRDTHRAVGHPEAQAGWNVLTQIPAGRWGWVRDCKARGLSFLERP